MGIRFLFPINLLSLILILGLAIAQNAQPNELPAIKAFPNGEDSVITGQPRPH